MTANQVKERLYGKEAWAKRYKQMLVNSRKWNNKPANKAYLKKWQQDYFNRPGQRALAAYKRKMAERKKAAKKREAIRARGRVHRRPAAVLRRPAAAAE